MKNLSDYHPILCGTLPIGVDIDGSDLDIILEVVDFDSFEKVVKQLYKEEKNFTIKRTIIRERPVIKANFTYEGFAFELFGQPQSVEKQHAYLHMVIEHALIKQFPSIAAKVIALKKQGLKTEPAFCKLLGLDGDPYEQLLQYGKDKGIVH